ncbi:hypothetical protein PHJA_000139400 [Phtheirospermum japonicum]|uniref:Uncharacterized protein n=1 Tax=Phtheirospermum japonicum TaxID=374723 RepID=A0A830AYM9_9LAMI|nr:hypothetical protein PHJA_000139400 [Phtheirospermum japonicum]
MDVVNNPKLGGFGAPEMDKSHCGVEIQQYPTKRRDFSIYRVAGRIIDFEKKFPKNDLSGKDIFGFWEMDKRIATLSRLQDDFIKFLQRAATPDTDSKGLMDCTTDLKM